MIIFNKKRLNDVMLINKDKILIAPNNAPNNILYILAFFLRIKLTPKRIKKSKKNVSDNNLNNISFQLYKPSVDGETYAEAPTISDLAKICEYAFEKIKNTNINYSFEILWMCNLIC